jgi:hypothetical protein
MASSNFSSLRNNRKTFLNKLAEETKKESSKASYEDARFWKLSVDPKTKIGYAVLRFLPAPKNEELPWVRRFSHGFKGPQGQWFIENCPTTRGGASCPVCKSNNKLWNSGVEDDKAIARDRKRKLRFISNVLVIDDPKHPENNGKVFLFEYGAKIYDKIKDLIEPQFPDQEPANPFDFWEGADFKLKSREYEGFQNYDKSEFASPAELANGDDDKKEEIWALQHSLEQFVAEKEFKPYEELEKKLTEVLTGEGKPRSAQDAINAAKATPADAKDAAETIAKEEKKKARKQPSVKEAVAIPPAPADDDDAAIEDFFKNVEGD